jgi:hypothetical protein
MYVYMLAMGTHTQMHRYIYIYIQTQIYTCIYVARNPPQGIYIHTYIHTYIHDKYIHAYSKNQSITMDILIMSYTCTHKRTQKKNTHVQARMI